MVQKVNGSVIEAVKAQFGEASHGSWDESIAAGKLYVIDVSIFSQFESDSVDGCARFTPGTVTLLPQDTVTKNLLPIAEIAAPRADESRGPYPRC
jgi:hypothetical protein